MALKDEVKAKNREIHVLQQEREDLELQLEKKIEAEIEYMKSNDAFELNEKEKKLKEKEKILE